MKTFNIKIAQNNEIKEAELVEGLHCLEFKYQTIHIKKEVAGRSSFFLLGEIRKDLETQGIFILCMGSRYDVYARGMHAAYILRLGSPAQKSDIVNIFDPVEEANIGKIRSVEEQEDYRALWSKSLENFI